MADVKCINIAFCVPKEDAEEVQTVFKKHASWMEEFYSNSEQHLLNSYFTRSIEYKDPTDPSKGETGNILFTINERFTSQESVVRHIQSASKNDYFVKFAEILQTYGKVVAPLGSIYKSIR